jgi:hypothetical protein
MSELYKIFPVSLQSTAEFIPYIAEQTYMKEASISENENFTISISRERTSLPKS